MNLRIILRGNISILSLICLGEDGQLVRVRGFHWDVSCAVQALFRDEGFGYECGEDEGYGWGLRRDCGV